VDDKLNMIYGIDAIMTRPDTDNTINGRNEDDDEITEVGGYIQTDYKVHEKFSILAALRYDFHNFVADNFFSPRAALIYKPTNRHTVRATFNRAFGSPSSNNLNLDINQVQDAFGLGAALFPSFGFSPATDVRAVGNRNGYSYQRDPNEYPQFRSPFAPAAYGLGVDLNDYYSLGDAGLNNVAWGVARGGVAAVFNETFSGLGDVINSAIVPSTISGIDNVIASLNLTTGEFAPIDMTSITDYAAVKNQITQTYEIGYKGGLCNDKLFVTVDAYRSDIQDFVSPLTNITPNVFLDPITLREQIEPIIQANLDNPDNLNLTNLLTASLDQGDDGNFNGTAADELADIYAGAAGGIPFGTISPIESTDGSALYVTYINIGDITIYGVDLGVTYYPTKDLKLSVGYSFVDKDSVQVEGAQLGYVGLNAPKHKLGFRANYNIDKVGLNVGLSFRWQDDFPANSGAYIGRVEDVHEMDLMLSYVPKFSPNSRISLTVQNLYNNQQQHFVGAPVIGTVGILKLGHTF
jgi:iron complex outermembrane receptor protein